MFKHKAETLYISYLLVLTAFSIFVSIRHNLINGLGLGDYFLKHVAPAIDDFYVVEPMVVKVLCGAALLWSVLAAVSALVLYGMNKRTYSSTWIDSISSDTFKLAMKAWIPVVALFLSVQVSNSVATHIIDDGSIFGGLSVFSCTIFVHVIAFIFYHATFKLIFELIGKLRKKDLDSTESLSDRA